jgi:methionyl-tRNA formyltransferase
MPIQLGSAQPAARTCVFVGATSLLIDCAAIAVDNGWQLVAVVSEDERVTAWADERRIPVVTWSDFEAGAEIQADCLFSLVNPLIVPGRVLGRFRFCANFHDALLPGHRGVNCAAWALAAGDGLCGVTWHAITDEVDAGAALCQGSIRLRDDDTAFSVSLRCTELAVRLFPRVLAAAAGPPRATSAPRAGRNGGPLHLRRDSPPDGGVLRWTQPAWLLRRLVRATNTGPAPNTFGSALMVLPEGVCYVTEADDRLEHESGENRPGTVVRAGSDEVAVACGEGVLVIRVIADGNGSPLAPASLRSLRQGAVLRTVPAAEVRLAQETSARAFRRETEAVRLIRAGCSRVGRAAGAPGPQYGSSDEFDGQPARALAAVSLVLAALTGDACPRFALGRVGGAASQGPPWPGFVSATAPVEVATRTGPDELIGDCKRLIGSTALFVLGDLRLRYGGRLVPRWDFAVRARGRVVPAVGFEPDVPMPDEWPLTVLLDDAEWPDAEPRQGSLVTFLVGSGGRLRWTASCAPVIDRLLREAAGVLG